MNKENARHVLGLSGGKDSAALAIYLKEKGELPDIEYFFCDTGAELKEVYEFLDRLEGYLGKEVARLSSGKPFDHHLKTHGNFLPSPKERWCTREMKIKPFLDFVGDDECFSYIGIRADENRGGYDTTLSPSKRVRPLYPFIQDGIMKDDVFRILRESIGIPEYYKWRSRSGCYFCFFQRKDEWIGLHDHHPELFERAAKYEKFDKNTGKRFTWSQSESLPELLERASDIRARRENLNSKKKRKSNWQEKLLEDDEDEQSCLICSL